MKRPLEQANRNPIRLDIWKQAKTLTELHHIVDRGSHQTIDNVYRDLIGREQTSDIDQCVAIKPLLHSETNQDS